MRPSHFLKTRDDSSDDEPGKENYFPAANALSSIKMKLAVAGDNEQASSLLTEKFDPTIDKKDEIITDEKVCQTSETTNSTQQCLPSIQSVQSQSSESIKHATRLGTIVETTKYEGWHNVGALILFGYRRNYSFKQLIISLFGFDKNYNFGVLHNEFANVWSELLPGILYLIIIYYWLFSNYQNNIKHYSIVKQAIIFVCMPMYGLRALVSAYAHGFHSKSQKCNSIVWNCDFSSIVWNVFATSGMYLMCIFNCSDSEVMNVFIMVGLPLYAIVTYAVCNSESKKMKGKLLTLLVVVGNYAVLMYHLVNEIISGINSNYSSQFPEGFTRGWIFGSVLLIIAGQINDRMYPEKYYFQNKLLLIMKQNNIKENKNKTLNEIIKECRTITTKLIKWSSMALHIRQSQDKVKQKLDVYESLCDVYNHECIKHNIDPNYANLKCMKKFWYIYLFPSHAIWHSLVAVCHYIMLAGWISFLEMHSPSNDSLVTTNSCSNI